MAARRETGVSAPGEGRKRERKRESERKTVSGRVRKGRRKKEECA